MTDKAHVQLQNSYGQSWTPVQHKRAFLTLQTFTA